MSNNIQAFYEQVLTSLHYQVDKEGLISFAPVGVSPSPATVDKRRLVMPTKQWLRDGFGDDLQPFHPLAENIARKGVSPVLAHMQRAAKAVLSHYLLEISMGLMAIAADTKTHKDLPLSFSKFLKEVPQADKKSFEDFCQLMERASSKHKLMTVYLKHGGKHSGEKYNRLCVVSFPIFALCEGEDDSVLGVKLRKKDKKTFLALLHHILPYGDDPEYYSAGSNSRIAPYFDAFMHSYTKIAEQLNRLIARYGSTLKLKLPQLALEYQEGLADLREFYNQIPVLRGNEGGIDSEEKAAEPEPTRGSSLYQRVNEPPAPTRPVHTTAPAYASASLADRAPWEEPVKDTPRSAGEGVSMDEFRRRMNPSAPPQPVAPTYGAPQPQYGAPPVPYGNVPGYGVPSNINPQLAHMWNPSGTPMAAAAPVNPYALALLPMATAVAAPQAYGAQTGMLSPHYGGSRL